MISKKSKESFGNSNIVLIFAAEIEQKTMNKQLVNTYWWRFLQLHKVVR